MISAIWTWAGLQHQMTMELLVLVHQRRVADTLVNLRLSHGQRRQAAQHLFYSLCGVSNALPDNQISRVIWVLEVMKLRPPVHRCEHFRRQR